MPDGVNLNYENIPATLKGHAQWVCWEADYPGCENDDRHKAPRTPRGGFASVKDASTFSTFDKALAATKPGGKWAGGGVGFITTEGDDYVFIDLDHVRDPETGTLSVQAALIVDDLDTYTEVSPSGCGVRLIGKGRKPDGYGNGPAQLGQAADGDIEVYDGRPVKESDATGHKFLRLTGHILESEPKYIKDISEPLAKIVMEYLPRSVNRRPQRREVAGAVYLPDADTVIERIRQSEDEAVISLIDDAPKGNHSEADFALCVKLAFWCCRDAGLIDAVFRKTKLFRKKWDEVHGSLTYGNMTIENALVVHASDGGEVYAGWARDRYRKRTKGGHGALLHNVLARDLMNEEHARVFIGSPAVWNGLYWEFGPDAVKRACTARMDDIKKSEQAEVYNYIKTNAPRCDESNFSDGYYVAFSNCVVDLSTLETIEPSPDMLITGMISAEWAPDSGTGYADDFLNKLADGDEIVFQVLCEVAGSCMCSRRMTSQAAFCIGRADVVGGEASNGKSTYMNALRNMLGPAVTCNIEPRLMGQRFGLSGIVGKTANIADDISGKSLDGDTLAVFRKIATGFSVKVDVKNEDAFDYVPQVQNVFSMNEIPHPREANEGFFRRCAFIPFRHKFTPEDADIHAAQRMAEPANMARLAYLGACAANVMLLDGRDTFTSIPGMDLELETLREESDTVLAWTVNEGIEREDVVGSVIADMHTRYSRWCADSGSYGVARSKFTRRMNQLFQTVSTPAHDASRGHSIRCFGLKVKDS